MSTQSAADAEMPDAVAPDADESMMDMFDFDAFSDGDGFDFDALDLDGFNGDGFDFDGFDFDQLLNTGTSSQEAAAALTRPMGPLPRLSLVPFAPDATTVATAGDEALERLAFDLAAAGLRNRRARWRCRRSTSPGTARTRGHRGRQGAGPGRQGGGRSARRPRARRSYGSWTRR
ncbi:hypothetical protein NKH77_28870 [Streptomyces sp. M19]